MICKNCNALLSDNVAFCPHCGTKLDESTQVPAAEEPLVYPVVEPVVPSEAEPPVTQETTADEEFYIAPDAQKEPKSKKGIVISCVAALLALCMIGGIMLYVFVFNNPAYRLKKAVENSKESLQDYLDDTENLSEFFESYKDLLLSRAFSMELADKAEYRYDDWNYASESTMRLDYSGKEQMLGGSFDSSTHYDGEDTFEVTLDFFADKQALYLSMPQLGKDVYSVPLENFGLEFANSSLAELIGEELPDSLKKFSLNLFADVSWKAFQQQNPEAERFMNSLQIEKSEKRIPETQDLTVLSVSYDGKLLEELLDAYLRFAFTQFFGEGGCQELAPMLKESLEELWQKLPQIELYCGIDKNDRLVALYAFPSDDEADYLLIRLAGEKNPWEEVLISTQENSYGLSLEKTENGFKLSGGERRYLLLLVCDDIAGKLDIYEDGTYLKTMTYRMEGDDVLFMEFTTTDEEAETVVTYRFKPFETATKPQGTVVSIFDMTADELKQWLMSALT